MNSIDVPFKEYDTLTC